jgi:hypothetical protein
MWMEMLVNLALQLDGFVALGRATPHSVAGETQQLVNYGETTEHGICSAGYWYD